MEPAGRYRNAAELECDRVAELGGDAQVWRVPPKFEAAWRERWSGTFTGKEGFLEFFGIVGANADTLDLQVQQYICNPRRPRQVLVLLEEHTKAIATGTEFVEDIANLVGVNHHGKITSFKIWEDTSAVKTALTP